MKPKSAPTAKDLRTAENIGQVADLLRYGRHSKTRGGVLVLFIHKRHQGGQLKTWRNTYEQVLGHHCVNAILAGDDRLLQQMAEAVAALPPPDKPARLVEDVNRAAFCLLIMQRIANAEALPTVTEACDILAKDIYGLDVRQVRRWFDQIGIPKRPGRSGRAKGSRKRHGQN